MKQNLWPCYVCSRTKPFPQPTARLTLGFILAAVLILCLASPVRAGNHKAQEDGSYTASKSYVLHDQWSVTKFITPSPPGAYSYLHLGEFLPQAVIYRAGNVRTLQNSDDPMIRRIALADKAGNMVRFHDMVVADNSPVRGAIVVRRGKIVYEQYPGMRSHENHVWMSVAKPFTSLLIGQLEHEAEIDVSKPFGAYMQRARGTEWENIRIIDALNMQTGLDLVEGPVQRADPSSMISQFFAAEVGIANYAGEMRTHDEVLFSVRALRSPGEVFEYSSAVTQMLGRLIEEVTNQRRTDLAPCRHERRRHTRSQPSGQWHHSWSGQLTLG